MMSEELIVKIKLDTTDIKNQMSGIAKDVNNSLGKSAKGAANSTQAINASMSELQGTMEQIKNLQLYEAISKESDKFKHSLDNVSASWKSFIKVTKSSIGGIGETISSYFRGIERYSNDKGPLERFKNTFAEIFENSKLAFNELGHVVTSFGKLVGSVLDTTAMKIAGTVALIFGTIAGIKKALGVSNLIKAQYYEASSLGLSVSQYREWAYIFESVGESADDLADAIKTLSSEQAILAEGSEGNRLAFEALGLSVAQVTNMSQDELFRETVTRLQQVEDQVKRTTLAYTIFGEDTAARLTNVLKLNNEEMRKMSENFYLLGGGISESFTDKAMKLASAVHSLRTAWSGLTNTMAELFMPVVQKVVEWLTKAIVVVNLFLKTVFNLDIGSSLSGVGSASSGLGNYTESVEQATGAVEKLKRVTMGFDELNIVGNPNSSSSGSADSGGSSGIDISPIDTKNSIFSKAQEQIEAFQEKVRAFMEEWKTELAIIGAALGVLTVAGLIDSLGKALGMGEKFHKVLTNIRKLAGTAIVMTLQYSFVNEFMDNFIDGQGIKEYIKGLLVAALGTAALYAMWGPTGLVIGLGVTAVASLKAVMDNGGVTNMESLIVAITGIVAAIGSIAIAWKNANIAGLISGAAAAIKTGVSGIVTTFTGFVATITGAFSSLFGVIGQFTASIGAVFGATGTGAIVAGSAVIVGAIAAISSVVVYLTKHWDEVAQAARNFFSQNIAPKIDNISNSFKKIGVALGPVGKAITSLINVIGDFFKSINILDAVGKAFDKLGGIIFTAVSSTIAGAINQLLGIFDGFTQAFAGIVQIISGLIQTIVNLFKFNLDEARKSVKLIINGIVDLFNGLYKLVVSPIERFVNGVIGWFVKLWDELVGHSIVPDMMDDIVECFMNLPSRVFQWVAALVAGVISRFTEMWNNVLQGMTEKLNEITQKITTAWSVISGFFNTNIAPKFTVAYWLNVLDGMRSGASQKLDEVRQTVSNIWEKIRGYFNSTIAPKFTKAYWLDKFEAIRSAASDKITAVKGTLNDIWQSICGWFRSAVAPKFTVSYWTDKFSSIKEGARNAFNGIIEIIENAINKVIRKINRISFELPEWAGGDEIGFDIDEVRFGRLAKGGITTGSTIANIGEAGTEAVLPLENNTGWMDILADRIAARNQGPSKIVLKVGERELGWATINGINQITKQTGGLQLVL